MKRIVLFVLSLLFLVSCGVQDSAPEVSTVVPTEIVELSPTPEVEEEPAPEPQVKEDAPSHKKEEIAPETKEEPVLSQKEEATLQTKEEDVPTNVEPEEPEEEKKPICTVLVSCKKALGNIDDLDEEKAALIPSDGYILSPCYVEFTEGESVFDVTKRCLGAKGISFGYEENKIYNSVYVKEIGGLSEKDLGSYSGWMYTVNGKVPNYGCSEYTVKEGDIIEFYYSK